jgi:hypothetical protein
VSASDSPGHGVGIHLALDRAVLAVDDGVTGRIVPSATGSLSTLAVVEVDRRGRIRVGGVVGRPDGDVSAVGAVVGRLRSGDEKGHEFGDGTLLGASELVAEVLKSLRIDYETNTGSALGEASVAVPDSFAADALERVRRAAALAGLREIQLVTASVAASFGADLDSVRVDVRSTSDTATWLVCLAEDEDFTVSVVRSGGGAVTVLGHATIPDVNGVSLNASLARRACRFFAAEQGLDALDVTHAPHSALLRRVAGKIDRTKRDVWRLGTPAGVFVESWLSGDDDTELDVEFELTPALLEEAQRESLEGAPRRCLELLASVGVAGDSVRTIVLAGACADDPHLRRVLEAQLGVSALVDAEPLTVVARGAAVLAAPSRHVLGEHRSGEAIEAAPQSAPASGGVDGPRVWGPPTDAEEGEASESSRADMTADRSDARLIDPARVRELRSQARTQRRRLLDIHRRVAERGDELLTAALADLVSRRLYERMDALVASALRDEAASEREIEEALHDLAETLDEIEARP